MKDAVATMGDVLPEDAGGRDAVHVAVFSATCSEEIRAGRPVAVLDHGERDATVYPTHYLALETVGIVDPFLAKPVKAGERFWVYLMPRTITALSHRWSHPAFDDTDTVYATPSAKIASEAWLRRFCDKIADCPGYEAVMAKAAEIADGGRGCDWDTDYMYFADMDAHGAIPPEFWDHVEVVLGRPIKGERAKYFTCSC